MLFYFQLEVSTDLYVPLFSGRKNTHYKTAGTKVLGKQNNIELVKVTAPPVLHIKKE